jgi:hypothetical protein
VKNKKLLLSVSAVVVGLILIGSSFYAGLNWTQLTKNLNLGNLDYHCFTYNNLNDAYQVNCYDRRAISSFVMKPHLSCTVQSNIQNYGNDSETELSNVVMMTKADYDRGVLDLNDKQIVETVPDSTVEFDELHDGQITYDIIVNDQDNIIATRTGIDSESGNKIQETISLSKKSGKGIKSWNYSQDSALSGITTEYFMCQ